MPMPLLKLWNSLLGRRDLPGPRADQAKTETTVTAKTKPAGRGILGIGSRGPHGSLCKLLRRVQAETVLEICVGDGSRAIAALQALSSNNPGIRYAAIDQFELAGGPLTLKGFHQALRTADLRRAQFFPETIERGLLRVATTIGPVDLVLIAAPPDRWQTPAVQALISRVTHGNTVVFFEEGDTWNRYEPATQLTQTRRAA
jgi:hypothetical protein